MYEKLADYILNAKKFNYDGIAKYIPDQKDMETYLANLPIKQISRLKTEYTKFKNKVPKNSYDTNQLLKGTIFDYDLDETTLSEEQLELRNSFFQEWNSAGCASCDKHLIIRKFVS